MVELARDFWNNKKVLVTGHTGFKGSWLCLWLEKLGAKVCGVSLEPKTSPSLFYEADVGSRLKHYIADIRDLEKVKKIFSEFAPEIVFHLAAQPLVRYSYTHPVDTYSTNVMGTVNLLEAARSSKSVKSIVCITTDKCYDNREWMWGYRENDPLGGSDPYSSSKACTELICNAYRKSYFDANRVGIASVRAGNVIGGGDWAFDRLIPDILHALIHENQIEIRNPNAVRPWQHVLEPLYGYMLVAQGLHSNPKTFSEAWNFGPNEQDCRSVEWIVEKMEVLWGRERNWCAQKGLHPHEANFLKLDISKAKMTLGWEPKWTLDSTLKSIVDWQKAFLKNSDMRAFTISQIQCYEDLKSN